VTAPRVLGSSPEELRDAAELLRSGGLVAFPTETVYGLGVHVRDEPAVRRLFAVKRRPADNPLIVHVADADGLERVASNVTPLARHLAARFWPGPLTLVLDARDDVPTVATGGLRTVGVRVPDHPVANALLVIADVPVAAPSANRSGRPSPTTAAHVVADLDGEVDVVVDGGPCRIGVESTVVDARGAAPVVLREGMITREQLGLRADDRADDVALAASPGTRYRHYAPRCPVVIAPTGRGRTTAVELAADGRRVGLVAPTTAPSGVVELACPRDATELGAVLYRAFRDAEDAALDVVVVEAVPSTQSGRAVMDRLRRAAAG
jgi:L-threonylcarbamoyladenylate synthase